MCKFFDKKAGSRASVNEDLAPELHKSSKDAKSMPDLRTIFGK